MEETLKQILNEIKGMHSDINELKDMRLDINELKQGQQRLQKKFVDSLGAYTEKIIEHVDDKTAALNRRVYNVETDIQRISRQ